MARKMKYEIGPEKLLQAVHDMYARAHDVCDILDVETEGCVVRGNGKCISSDSEDLVASFLYANLKNRIPNLYIMVNPNVRRKDGAERTRSVCPDVLISIKRSETEYDALYVLELKQNTGWMRGESRFRDCAEKLERNLEWLKRRVCNFKLDDFSGIERNVWFPQSLRYDIALLADVNDCEENMADYGRIIQSDYRGRFKMVAFSHGALYNKSNPQYVPDPNDESFDYIISRILDAWDAFRKKHR